jgi:hypothetical protein
MGRKAVVAVARAKVRAVGIMVAGWEVLGDIGDNLSKST